MGHSRFPVVRAERAVGVLDDTTSESHGASVGPLESGHYPQEGGLTAPRWAQNRGDRADGHLQIDAGQHRLCPEGLVEVGDAKTDHLGTVDVDGSVGTGRRSSHHSRLPRTPARPADLQAMPR